MAHITELPQEVISHIGRFLTKRDILKSILTCKSLLQSISHLLWRDITLQTGELPLPVSRLQDNADKVQRLQNIGTIPPEYYHIVFPGLSCLKIHFKGANPTRRTQGSAVQEVNNMALIRLNPTIQDLTIDLANHNPSNGFWEAITTTLRKPKSLRLTSVCDLLGRTPVNAFWDVCARFEEVSCHGRDGLLSDLVPPIMFPGLDRITLGINTVHSDINNTIIHLQWLKKCPNLTRMRWELADSELPVVQFAEALEQTTWRQLQDLCLTGIIESDQDLSIVVCHLPPTLTSLEMDSKSFGPQCFAWLRIHQFARIRVLRLRECVQLSSLIVLEILHSCVHLEDLEAFHVALSDLYANPQPWVCRGLRRLRVYFDNDTDEVDLSQMVFHHLSGLEQLEDLDVDEDFMWELLLIEPSSTTSPTTTKPHLKKQGPPIQWRLDSGLGQLIRLTRLRTVHVEKSFDTARPVDVEWMLQHWPHLLELTGPLVKKDRPGDWKVIVKLLEARGVKNHNIHFSTGSIPFSRRQRGIMMSVEAK
ncbi:MAG: hypothetical protein J3R72DRAFT_438437 [Linnemannia gamsii]|nr:MAG: hypothetical protein J3R72DRAFT_438437 [Linnemannia gamsii]